MGYWNEREEKRKEEPEERGEIGRLMKFKSKLPEGLSGGGAW